MPIVPGGFGQATIVGSWIDPTGATIAYGTLQLKLSQDGVLLSTHQVAPRIVSITLDNTGSVPANTVIWGNDMMNPAGTYYRLTVQEQGGGVVYGPENFTIAGPSPINLNNLIPIGGGAAGTSAVNLQDSVQILAGSQTIGFAGAINTLIELTTGAGGATITLPSAIGTSGQKITIVKVDAGVGAGTIQPTGGQSISGRANVAITNMWQVVILESDNLNWIIVGLGG